MTRTAGRGTFPGRITGRAGAALVGAGITVQNIDTGVKTASSTNDQVNFQFATFPRAEQRHIAEWLAAVTA